MTVVSKKELPGLSREAEEQHLRETLEIVKRKVEQYREEVSTMRTDIDDMLAHFHDDNPELINSLENSYTMHTFLSRALERNERALKKPYFGRIDFYDETLGVSEAFYIGRCGISKDATHPVVIDWRAPVANVYYENGLGECTYLSPEGKELPIDLKLKRTYEIADGALINMFDTEVIANDDLLTSYLSKNKQAVLGEIVATIQKEQNDIIRKSPYHNCLVQGVAGSGKTTVAMHRISFILYNYAERFRPEDFYIVGSNRILLNYITGVLPDLDVYGIRQMTMEQLFVRLLYEDWDENKYRIRSGSASNKNAVKGTLGWFRTLEEFCQRFEFDLIPRESIYLNRAQFIEGFVDGKAGVHDRRDRGRDDFESSHESVSSEEQLLLIDGSAIEQFIKKDMPVSTQTKINMLNEQLRNKLNDEFLGKGIKYTGAEQKAILKAYRNLFGSRTWRKSIFVLYRDFLKEQIDHGYDVDVPDKEFDVYDLAALAYLYKRLKETDAISEAHHVVIDEAQDFGMMVYSVLKYCMKDCTYTIMGDVSQNIHFAHGLNDWEELKALYIKDPQASFGILKKSYRNTVEISNFATDILHHGKFRMYPVEPIIRHGEAPRVIEVEDATDAGVTTDSAMAARGNGDGGAADGNGAAGGGGKRAYLLEKAASICREWQAKDLNTIAIICRDEDSAQKVSGELAHYIDIIESNLETAEFGNGIMVLPVEYTKGLEFDAVLILDPTREEYPVDDGHAKLLYVAATRALHELCVLHTGNLTGLIADPVPEEEKPVPAELASGAEKPMLAEQMPRTGNSMPEEGAQANFGQSPSADANIAPKTQGTSPFKPIARVRRIGAETGTDTMKLLASKKLKQAEPAISPQAAKAAALQKQADEIFGSMPRTELMRPVGHAKIDQAIRWVNKKADGMYLQSTSGILRISPVHKKIIRVTFAKDEALLNMLHPKISLLEPFAEWKLRDTPKLLEMKTREIYLQAEKATGAITFMTIDKKPLLAERKNECHLLEKPTFGPPRARLYLDWAKNEVLAALGTGIRANLPLKNVARYISHNKRVNKLPMVVSDKGYGLVVASGEPVFCCTLPTHGMHVCVENTDILDYYFIIGKNAEEIISTYGDLCGKN